MNISQDFGLGSNDTQLSVILQDLDLEFEWLTWARYGWGMNILQSMDLHDSPDLKIQVVLKVGIS